MDWWNDTIIHCEEMPPILHLVKKLNFGMRLYYNGFFMALRQSLIEFLMIVAIGVGTREFKRGNKISKKFHC
jgi:hypothetical protein